MRDQYMALALRSPTSVQRLSYTKSTGSEAFDAVGLRKGFDQTPTQISPPLPALSTRHFETARDGRFDPGVFAQRKDTVVR